MGGKGARGSWRVPLDLVEADAKRDHEGNVDEQHYLVRGPSIRRGESRMMRRDEM